MISGAQVRAARALLGWDVRGLSRRAVVSIRTVNAIEGSYGVSSINHRQQASIPRLRGSNLQTGMRPGYDCIQ